MAAQVIARYLAMLPSQPGRTRKFIGDAVRFISNYDWAVAPAHLPERMLHDIFPAIDQQEVALRHKYDAWTLPYGEMFVLAAITRHLKPRRVFEIGTYGGAATVTIASHGTDTCQIYTLDLPADHPKFRLPGLEDEPPDAQHARIGQLFSGTPYAGQISQLYGDSATFDFSAYAGSIDLVLIDAVHTYEYVKTDTANALVMLSESGTIVWDDCSSEFPGVVRALDEVGTALPIYRVSGTRFAIYARKLPRHASPNGNGGV